jgi:hypothetical protein
MFAVVELTSDRATGDCDTPDAPFAVDTGYGELVPAGGAVMAVVLGDEGIRRPETDGTQLEFDALSVGGVHA